MESREFRAGFAHLASLGTQFRRMGLLSPDSEAGRTRSGISRDADRSRSLRRRHRQSARTPPDDESVFQQWKRGIIELAQCSNVMVKLSGLGMRLGGFGFEDEHRAPSSIELAQAWRPWIESCIEAFGPDRCMYGSNFPVDKGSYGYCVGLNALKRLTAAASSSERGRHLLALGQDVLPIARLGVADRQQ